MNWEHQLTLFIELPDCGSGDSAEDRADEELGGSLDNLSGHQFKVVADVILYKKTQVVSKAGWEIRTSHQPNAGKI